MLQYLAFSKSQIAVSGYDGTIGFQRNWFQKGFFLIQCDDWLTKWIKKAEAASHSNYLGAGSDFDAFESWYDKGFIWKCSPSRRVQLHYSKPQPTIDDSGTFYGNGDQIYWIRNSQILRARPRFLIWDDDLHLMEVMWTWIKLLGIPWKARYLDPYQRKSRFMDCRPGLAAAAAGSSNTKADNAPIGVLWAEVSILWAQVAINNANLSAWGLDFSWTVIQHCDCAT